MKIGILIDRLNIGGVEKIAIEEVLALNQQKVDAKLLVLRKQGVVKNAFPDLLKKTPIVYLDDRLPKVLRISFKFPIFYFFSLFHLTYPLLIPFVIKRKEFDYIISHSTYTTFTAVGIKKITGIRFSSFIWDPIGYILGRVYANKFTPVLKTILLALSGFFDSLIVRNADAILVGGDAHNKYFKKLKNNVKIITIPPSVYPVRNMSKRKNPYILIATAWKKGKNPEYLLELVEKIPHLQIKMAGIWLDPVYRKEFAELVKHNNMRKNISILGEVSEKELKKLYRSASVVLQTNDDRGFGMPALEAAGNGTTFIIPEGQGVCNLFINAVDGFFTKEKDTKTIVKYLTLLLKNTKRNEKMSEHALKTVQTKYSWDIHATQLMEVVKIYVKK